MHESSDISRLTGLSPEEAAARLARDGYNELPSARPRSLLAIALEVMKEPMFLMLCGCGAIYLLLGDLQEAAMLLAFVFFVIGITLYQQGKTERALAALRDLSSPRALVIRGGRQQRIPGREVVRGDLIVLKEGDRVPADGVLIDCNNLMADESLLTGESLAVRKKAGDSDAPFAPPGGDDLCWLFSGTLVVRGEGIASVRSTGLDTELGKIGVALQGVTDEGTPLQKEVGRLVRRFSLAAIALCIIVVVVYGASRNDWLNGLLAGLAMAMSLLPEELPVILTVFLALGAWRIARKEVLTRKIPAVEALGSTTVLCIDKTGTLTMNRMEVVRLVSDSGQLRLAANEQSPLPEKFHTLVEFAILASQRDPYEPMDKAIRGFGDRFLSSTEHLHDDWSLVREYPLSPELLAVSHVWRSPVGSDYVIAAKGAPEVIADLCHLPPEETARLNSMIAELAADGLRLLGVAKASFRESDLPGKQHDFAFTLAGLIGLADPVREKVAESLKECYSAGIRMVMITGDYPGTARSIARQIGLEKSETVITGPEIDRLDEEGLRERLRGVNICARVVPEQKLRLVKALKADGEIVAMTGDGVNDAPALKAAHIGVAMGERGTDVAREAADLVLLKDDFSSIVQAVRLGRRIFDNLQKATAYTIAIHVPIAGMSLLPVLIGWPLVLLPVHIVFLEMIIDPACSIVFEMEQEERSIMERPPRPPATPLLSSDILFFSLLQGVIVLSVVFAVYAGAHLLGETESIARGLAFTTLIVANLGLIITNRSRSLRIGEILRITNPALWWVMAGAISTLAMALYLPFLNNLFRFSTPPPNELLFSIAAAIISILCCDALKQRVS
jgi:Ca2+-transporting ATPase